VEKLVAAVEVSADGPGVMAVGAETTGLV